MHRFIEARDLDEGYSCTERTPNIILLYVNQLMEVAGFGGGEGILG